jgi:hypothetical protein
VWPLNSQPQLPFSVARWQLGSRICFATFVWVKNHKIADNSTTSKARLKIRTDLESMEFSEFLNARFTKFKSNWILHDKIYHWFLETAKLITRWKITFVSHIFKDPVNGRPYPQTSDEAGKACKGQTLSGLQVTSVHYVHKQFYDNYIWTERKSTETLLKGKKGTDGSSLR